MGASSSSDSPPQVARASESNTSQLPTRRFPKLFAEFLGFISSIREGIADPYEGKLINLILGNFEEVAEAGTSQGQRGYLINRVIQDAGRSISSTVLATGGQQKLGAFPFVSLSSLELGQFKGFSNKERIPLDRKYNLVYGPNGSGKSSLCEALEYSMLGYINEASSRRMELGAYIQNRFTGLSEEPILTGIDVNGEKVAVKPDPSLLGFCFVEKNRIESFGRIAANTPAAKQNLLSSLFGLSDFNDFVANFTRNITSYIDTVGIRQNELSSKSQSLAVHRDNLRDSKARLQSLRQSKIEMGKKVFPSLSPEQLVARLNDPESINKEIADLASLIAKQVPDQLSAIASSNITNAFANLETSYREFISLLHSYSEQKEKVLFKDLFAAVASLENNSPDKCPVCETPIEHATKHPYANARTKLNELTAIAQLENAIDSKAKKIRKVVLSLKGDLESRRGACVRLATTFDGPDISLFDGFADLDNMQLSGRCLSLIEAWKAESSRHAQVDLSFSSFNLKVAAENDRKSILGKQLENLTSMNKTEGMISSEKQSVEKCEQEIQDFSTKNAVLIKEAEDEKPVIEQNKLYVRAYNSFLIKLNKYKDELPLLYVKQLNDATLEIYNLINSSDRRYEMAHSITLPSAVGEAIQIAFADNPEEKIDVLNVFSEGHLRCLGLSILLAKNIQTECPVIIFDDVVNAIDDDHRGGIRDLLFSYEKLASKQIVLTTHGGLFVSELEQRVKKADYDKMVRKLSFILDQNSRLIRVRGDSQKNYLVRLGDCIDTADWKEALYFCRCCLENLSALVWKKIGRKGFATDFSVIIRAPNGTPDLMSVVISLNRCLKKTNALENSHEITSIFDYLSGIEASSNVIWQYLNKGTHEEEGLKEFDCTIVLEVSQKLVRLDELTK